jgi:N-acetylglucosaminyldiphosphoundecaprenol N-acetyl-beta-D-mannosaminyltransferase
MKSLLIIIAALLISYGLQFPLRWLAQHLGLRRRRVYLLSGLALALAISVPLLLYFGNDRLAVDFCWVLGAAFVAGILADQFRLPHFVQVLFGGVIAYWATRHGFVIHEFKPPFFSEYVDLGAWAPLFSVLWILIVTYSVLLCRRLPGLAGGLVGMVALALLAVMFIVFAAPNPLAAPLACALAGAALGTFPHDMPYKIMPRLSDTEGPRLAQPTISPFPQGAAGHWVLGFALGLLSVVGFLKNTAFLLLAAPLLLLGVPFVEATYAFVYGSRRNRAQNADPRFSFSVGRRRELLHEAMLRGGLSPRRCVAVFLAVTAYCSAIAILLALMVRVTFILKLIVAALLVIAGFVVFYCAAHILSRRFPKAEEMGEQRDFLDVPVTVVDMDGALAKIESYIAAHTPHMVVTTDSSAIVKAHEDAELAEIIRHADLVTPDGAGVVWMAKVLGLPIQQRVSGVDLLDRICALAAARGWGIYMLGAEPGVADEAAQKLCAKHPGLRIIGVMHGYYAAQEEAEVVTRIAAAKPDVLFVGFGIPRQEKWIARYLDDLGVPVAIGVGGSFDVISGRLQRAPRWMQVAGLEWLFRTIQQPKRLPRLLSLPRLFVMTLRAAFLKKK